MPVIFFLLLLIVTCAVAFYFLRPTKSGGGVQQSLEAIQDSRTDASSDETILKEEGYSRNAEVSDIVRQIPGALGTLDLIRQAGLGWTVSSVMGISLLATVLTAWTASFFLPGVFFAVIAGVVAGSIPYIYLFILRDQRFRKCDQLLPNSIHLMPPGLPAC